MKISAVVRALVRANATPEMILAAVEAAEDENETAIERRRASDRERQNRRRNVMSRDVTVTPCDTPPSDKEKSPTPPKEINTPRETTRARGARLPENWALPATWGKWALVEGHSEASIRFEAEKFKDFWLSKSGQDAKKTDWERTWRNWMRNVGKSQNLGTPPPKPKSDFDQHQDAVQRELDKALGRTSDDEFTGKTYDIAAGDYRPH